MNRIIVLGHPLELNIYESNNNAWSPVRVEPTQHVAWPRLNKLVFSSLQHMLELRTVKHPSHFATILYAR